jgi:putative toxin-antitoxin system antitoxin component (TIGR02293 family)
MLQIVSSLGLRAVSTPLELAERVRQGLSPGALARVKQLTAFSDPQLARCLGTSLKTLSRIHASGDKRLSPQLSDRLYRLARVFTLAETALGDREAARGWLQRPQPGLGGKVPRELLATEAGAREVEDLLGRIEHGVLA